MNSKTLKVRPTLPLMYRSVNGEGIIIECNEGYAKRLRYTKDEAIGMHILEHTAEEHHDRMLKIFEKWKTSGKVDRIQVKLKAKNGERVKVVLKTRTSTDSSDKEIKSITTILDISEIKALQNLVKVRKYESLYENSPDLYRTVNYKGIIIDCNRAYQMALGYGRDEIIGTDLIEHTAERSRAGMAANMEHWRETGKTEHIDAWLRRKDGTEFPVTMTPTNLFDDDGMLIGRNVVINDATKVHDAEQLLNERNEIDRLKGEFLSAVAHELKSPMTPIIGFAQALKRQDMLGELNEKQANALNIILDNANRLRTIIMDLLDAHKLEIDRMSFNTSEFDWDEMTETMAAQVKHMAGEKGVTVTCKNAEIGTVKTDRARIEQVITNFVNNAMDAVKADTGTIDIITEKVGDDIKLMVVDNGIGISEEGQKSLFTKFYRIDTKMTRKYGGTGLGLSICKGIIDNLGGNIGVESELGAGSKFYFVIPRRKENESSRNR